MAVIEGDGKEDYKKLMNRLLEYEDLDEVCQKDHDFAQEIKQLCEKLDS